MTFTELESSQALTDFVTSRRVCLVAFSATWCMPCRVSKPQLQALAHSHVPVGYVYESNLDDNDNDLEQFANVFCKSPITAFPTHVLFVETAEVERVNGFDASKLQAMLQTSGSETN